MAAIDKIYATKEQRDEFYAWCEKHKPDALPYFYAWTYPDDGLTHEITNFSEPIDMWMLVYCDIRWVTDFIKDQYWPDDDDATPRPDPLDNPTMRPRTDAETGGRE